MNQSSSKSNMHHVYYIKRFTISLVTVLFFISCSELNYENSQILIEKNSEEFVYELPYQDIISSQTATERVWKETKNQLVRRHAEGIFSPVRIALKDTSSFVLDASDGYIKRINHFSETMTKIGQGKGNGPGEFEFPFDFDIDSAGNFVVMDIAKRVVVTLDPSGEPLKTFQFGSASPTTLTTLDETRTIVMINGKLDERLSGTDGLFQIYDRETNELELYNDFLTDKEHLPSLIGLEMAFTGTIVNDQGNLIFLPKNINHIIRMNENGDLIYVRKTLDDAPLPAIQSSTNGNLMGGSLTDKSPTTSLDGFLIGDMIAVWSKTGIDKHGGHVFDFYDSSTGDYKHSINVPELGAITGLAMDSEFLSTINADGSVSVWRYNVL